MIRSCARKVCWGAVAALLVCAQSCGGENESGSSAGTGGQDGAAASAGASAVGGTNAKSDASTDAAADAGAHCLPNAIPLIVQADVDAPVRYWVPIEYQGKPASLHVDTGSSLTFLFLPPGSPDYVPHAGDIVIGCETLPVPGRNIDLGGSVEGLPTVGLLGADFFLSKTVEVDPVARKLTRYPAGSSVPGSESWSALPFEDVLGHIITPVILDTKPLRLMFDTGAPAIVWLGEPGRPGDTEYKTQDASGAPLTFYQGPSILEMANEPPRQVTVLRAPSWPYFENTVKALGGNIHGLIGLNVFGVRRLIFRSELSAIFLEPEGV